MTKRINVTDLPEEDSAKYLDGETTFAVYLTDILEANSADLLDTASEEMARARAIMESVGDDNQCEM